MVICVCSLFFGKWSECLVWERKKSSQTLAGHPRTLARATISFSRWLFGVMHSMWTCWIVRKNPRAYIRNTSNPFDHYQGHSISSRMCIVSLWLRQYTRSRSHCSCEGNTFIGCIESDPIFVSRFNGIVRNRGTWISLSTLWAVIQNERRNQTASSNRTSIETPKIWEDRIYLLPLCAEYWKYHIFGSCQRVWNL